MDKAKTVTPKQYAAGVDRGIQELQNQIKTLSKSTMGAKTLKSGMLSQTQMGRETMVDNVKEVESLKADLKAAISSAGAAKKGYAARYAVDKNVNLSATPNKTVYRYPYSEYYTNFKPQRGRKASGSSEKN
tara:strand:- start:45 stop:437 length:393 start_codon:yes stop_codon:yes gene_type:complete